jgi:HK97 family phage major capsid protein
MSKRKDLPAVPALEGKAASLFATNGERLAAVLSRPSANFPGMRPGAQRAEDDDEIATLAGAALKAAADGGKVAKRALERTEQLQANLQSMEQTVARLSNGSTALGSFAPQSIGATLRQKIEAGEADGFAALAAGNTSKARVRLEVGIRAALTHGTGSSSGDYMPSTPETGAVYAGGVRRLSLLDALPTRPTTRDAVEFVRITATDEAGVQEVEGAEKAEIEMIPEPARAEIATIAGHTTASKQVLSDAPALVAVVDRVMRSKVLSKAEHQLVNGDGSAGNIEGLLQQAPVYVPSVATEPADIIGECLATLADSGYSPSIIVLNPLDWHALQTQRATPSGEYLFGSPAAPIAPSLWNVPVVTSSSVPAGTGLAIDPAYVSILEREAVEVAASEHHNDNFVRNLITVRAECRIGLEVTDQWSLRQFELSPASSSS